MQENLKLRGTVRVSLRWTRETTGDDQSNPFKEIKELTALTLELWTQNRCSEAVVSPKAKGKGTEQTGDSRYSLCQPKE